MIKEQKFHKALQDVFIGAQIEGEGGFVNLMRIKSNYYRKIEEILKKDIEVALKTHPNFKDELFDKLYSFLVAILPKAAQSISTPRLFITISTKKFIPMKKMSFFSGKHRCSTMSKQIGFSGVWSLNQTDLNSLLMLQK